MKLFPQSIIEKLAEWLRLQKSRRYRGSVGRTGAMKEKKLGLLDRVRCQRMRYRIPFYTS